MNEYDIPKANKSVKKIVQLLIVVVVVVVAVMGVYYVTKVNKPASSESREIKFTVEKGLSTKRVAVKLSEQKIISNSTVFIIYTTLRSAGDKIQAGEYSLNPNMTIPEIVDVLTHGKVVSDARKLTVVEGLNSTQIATMVESRNIVKATEFSAALKVGTYNFQYLDIAKPLEYQGFLFPDTYQISNDETAEDIVQKMLTNFETQFDSTVGDDFTKKSLDLKTVITMASIIEKEVGRNKDVLTEADLNEMQRERELVASVFYNRLEIGMALESDATVNYITGKGMRSASLEDTKIKSPYNTYQVKGLPPGPISNPGIGSIKAAVNPAESDYLFFLNAPNGTAYFGKTLAEHNDNRVKYLR